jgi:hypothetical protein
MKRLTKNKYHALGYHYRLNKKSCIKADAVSFVVTVLIGG